MRLSLNVLRTTVVAAMLVAGTAPMTALPAWSKIAPESFADLSAKLQPAVVNISTTQQVEVGRQLPGLPPFPPGSPWEEFFRRFQQERGDGGGDGQEARPITREARSLGSGFIIDSNGYIVTNNHVITGQDGQTVVDKITVSLADDRKFEAKVVGRDPATDLALLKIEATNLPYVQWGDKDELRVGDWLIAIGNPLGLGVTVTAGIISALHRDIGLGDYDRLIQTDASINRGNSGGPMFDIDGNVIGIATAILSPTGGNIGIGFGIPADQARPVIEQLRATGKVKRGWLGVRIQPVSDEIAEGLGLKEPKGAIIANVEPNAPAARAGLRQGDVILKFDGRDITRSRTLSSIVSETPIGKSSELEVLRQGKVIKVSINIGERPGVTVAATDTETPKEKEKSSASEESARQSLGLSLQPITREVRQRLELEDSVSGVVISGVNQSSDAAAKGLRTGDVLLAINQQKVPTPQAAAAIVEEARKAGRGSVVVLVQRGKDTINFGIKLLPLKK